MSFQVDEQIVQPEFDESNWDQLLDEYDYSRPERGELRDGLIMQIEENGVLVSIGTKREGVIPWQDVRQMGEEFSGTLHVGDPIQVYIQDPENKDGDLVLSLTMVQVAKDWESASQMHTDGGIVRCKVVGFNKGGLLVQFNRIRGFVPASQIAQLHGRTAAEERQQALQRMVNQEIPLKVIEVDRERNRLVFSERSATQEWRKAQKHRLLSELQAGDILSGRVNQLTNFGAFIDLGGADGLAHISELSWQRVNHPREVLSPGQEVRVMVVEIDSERERIGLSLRKLQENPWDTIDQRYSLGQIVNGPVTNVTPFGAFVQIEEAVEGLIHASELDADPQTQPGDVLRPGQEITAKVISLDRQRQRMGLSLRRVAEDQDKQQEQQQEASEVVAPAGTESAEQVGAATEPEQETEQPAEAAVAQTEPPLDTGTDDTSPTAAPLPSLDSDGSPANAVEQGEEETARDGNQNQSHQSHQNGVETAEAVEAETETVEAVEAVETEADVRVVGEDSKQKHEEDEIRVS
jgi:small subunit ribosomal protein S1